MAGRLRMGVSTPGGPLADDELAVVSAAVDTPIDMVMWFADFASPPPLSELAAVAGRPATPMITWEPWLWRTDRPVAAESVIERIITGRCDDHLRDWAAELGRWPHEVYLRFGHEFNGHWYPWSASGGTAPGEYVTAWQRVHRIFGEHDAGNVQWVWTPSADMPDSAPFAAWYPGDECVDILGIDGYNWGTSQPWSTWRSPSDVFASAIEQVGAVNDDLPILIAEVSCAEAGGSKARWITELIDWLAGHDRVTGLVWFEHNKETDWRLTSSPESANAMATALRAVT